MRNIEHYLNVVKAQKVYKQAFKHALMESVFNEDMMNESLGASEKIADVRGLLKQNKLGTNPAVFKASLNQSKHKEMLTDYSIEDLSKMRLFKVPGYNIGYALKPMDGCWDIVAVHNNEPDVRGIGRDLMQSAIDNGGCYLDHFDSKHLSDLYSSMGFEEYKRYKYDPQYDEDGLFKNKYGELDVVYRKQKNCK
jgi:hypothetical protein